MITIDRSRCAYCGGCVSVCPVGALTLAETRLVVSEDCIDCGDCIPSCPVGALQSSAPVGRADPIQRRYDLVVVGAGPAGATAAQVAAEAGLSVLLLEKRQEVGSPVRCAEAVAQGPFLDLVEPDPLWIANQITQAEITVIAGGESRVVRASGGSGYILERRLFDRALAERAAQAGAEVRVKTAVTGLVMDEGRVGGVRIQRGDYLTGGGEVVVKAPVVIAADGIEAQVAQWAGLDVRLPLEDTMVCVQYLLAGVKVDPTCTYYTICHEVAPGGYAWVFPKGENRANVGLGVQADLWQEVAAGLKTDAEASGPGVAGDRTVLGFLARFIEDHPTLAQGYPVTLVAGNVPVAPPPKPMVSGGLMLVGDAARQVDPLTGGGIINGMQAARIAARVATEAIAAGDTSASFLSRYEERYHQTVGRKMARNHRLRGRFPPEKRADQRFVHAFVIAAAGG
jgi:digeranylgeranylglycerophospholipid reductase